MRQTALDEGKDPRKNPIQQAVSASIVDKVHEYQFLLSALFILLSACVIAGGQAAAVLIVLVLTGAGLAGIGYNLFCDLNIVDISVFYTEQILRSPKMKATLYELAEEAMYDEKMTAAIVESALNTSHALMKTVLAKDMASSFAEDVAVSILMKLVERPADHLQRVDGEQEIQEQGVSADHPDEPRPAEPLVPRLMASVLSEMIRKISGSAEVKEAAILALEQIMQDRRMELTLVEVMRKVTADETLQQALSTSAYSVGYHAVTGAVKQAGSSVKRTMVGVERPRRAPPRLIAYVPKS